MAPNNQSRIIQLKTNKKYYDKQETSKQQQKPTKQDFTLEAVLKKLEKIGIKVNLEELMKQ